jgi:hypothetical protein
MKTSGAERELWRGLAVAWLALFAACATPATRQAHVEPPSPCTDSLYVRLQQQHPDSLSERAAQRLQSLDRECAAARAESQRSGSHGAANGMMGMGHGTGGWVAMGIGVVMTVTMLLVMR